MVKALSAQDAKIALKQSRIVTAAEFSYFSIQMCCIFRLKTVCGSILLLLLRTGMGFLLLFFFFLHLLSRRYRCPVSILVTPPVGTVDLSQLRIWLLHQLLRGRAF